MADLPRSLSPVVVFESALHRGCSGLCQAYLLTYVSVGYLDFSHGLGL